VFGFQAASISQHSQVVIYDEGGSFFAPRLWWMLDYYSHPNISLLDGGLIAWKAEEGEVTTDVPAVAAGDFLPAADPTKIADYDYVAAHLGDDATAICAGLRAEAYAKEAIPGTSNLPFSKTFATGAAPVLREAAELMAFMAELGITPDKEVIFYCLGGYLSAHDYFVARALGFERVRLYDGALEDWKARNGPLTPGGGG
jgi:thiosulfate/3-mercaptopyruvate sulfurtransferase